MLTTATRRQVLDPKARANDYEQAVQLTGGVPGYVIDALVARDDTVAAAWTGHLPNGLEYRGLSLYRVRDGRIAETRHALIGPPPVT